MIAQQSAVNQRKLIVWCQYPSLVYYGLVSMGWSIANTVIVSEQIWVKLEEFRYVVEARSSSHCMGK